MAGAAGAGSVTGAVPGAGAGAGSTGVGPGTALSGAGSAGTSPGAAAGGVAPEAGWPAGSVGPGPVGPPGHLAGRQDPGPDLSPVGDGEGGVGDGGAGAGAGAGGGRGLGCRRGAGWEQGRERVMVPPGSRPPARCRWNRGRALRLRAGQAPAPGRAAAQEGAPAQRGCGLLHRRGWRGRRQRRRRQDGGDGRQRRDGCRRKRRRRAGSTSSAMGSWIMATRTGRGARGRAGYRGSVGARSGGVSASHVSAAAMASSTGRRKRRAGKGSLLIACATPLPEIYRRLVYSLSPGAGVVHSGRQIWHRRARDSGAKSGRKLPAPQGSAGGGAAAPTAQLSAGRSGS